MTARSHFLQAVNSLWSAPRADDCAEFLHVSSHVTHEVTRRILSETLQSFEDIDGNFLQQLRTTGFDARIWELYLHAAFRSQGYSIDRTHRRPDFLLNKDGLDLAVEAVIAGPSDGFEAKPNSAPETGDDIRNYFLNDVAVRLSGPLWTKLKRRYWQLPHVRGKPLVLAIAPFLGPTLRSPSDSPLQSLLFGIRATWEIVDDKLSVSARPVEHHVTQAKSIRSGLFAHEWMQNVSAVLFSNAGTITKFQRLGARRFPAINEPTLFHLGYCHHHDPDATFPLRFLYDVRGEERPDETWQTGLSIIHNPHAKFPLSDSSFPGAAHHRLLDGLVRSRIPAFHPYGSVTLAVMNDEASEAEKRLYAESVLAIQYPDQAFHDSIFGGKSGG
jgi:hypothetical protein